MKDYLQLFWAFIKVGALTFGGGYAMLPILQRDIVEKHGWVNDEEVMDYYAMAQCLPGIIMVNTSVFIGRHRKGTAGGIVAGLASALPSLVIITVIAMFLTAFAEYPIVQNAFAGIRACVVVLIVNAVLNAKYNAAEESGADCFFHVDIDELLGIDAVSLCTVFANTLDNAIEACRKIPEPEKRRISLKARYAENGYFSYEIVNSKRNEIRKKKDAFLTDKEDARSHGLGIASVQDVVRRYEGTLDISYTEDEFRVVILVRAK